MRNTSVALAIVAGVSLGAHNALAADLPARPAPIAVAPLYSWTGCYIGGNLGGAWANADFGGAANASGTSTSIAGGLQVGCDYQTGAFVFGIRNMYDWTDVNGSAAFGGPGAGFVWNSNMSWFDTLTGRVGYAVQPAWLLYLQGGFAWARANQSITGPAGVLGAQLSNTRTGWTIGAGMEYLISPNWSVFLEYNYADFGTNSATVAGLGTVNGGLQTQTLLVGLNWRWSGTPFSRPGQY